ncbi:MULTISPECIES: Rv3654c family TadE-like protein [unclassified Luteococcus]|uniref:Rv3654c family TadE-like protein n=1 Tax=unclassified Luteococcus TaxID=2639923 RepID=UPI00313A8E70
MNRVEPASWLAWPRDGHGDGTADRGGGTALTAALLLCLCAAMLVGVWIAGWVDSIHRARSAADLAALAGAQAHVGDGDACSAARAAAGRNGALLDSCAVQGGRRDFLVTVGVRMELRPVIGGSRREVVEQAIAGSLQREDSGEPVKTVSAPP